MATKKKMLQAAAGNAGGDPVVIEDVFSTYLYEGNQTVRTIPNGIDLDEEGGLVWLKSRTEGQNNYLFDTARGPNKFLLSDNTAGEQVVSDRGVTGFNSDGFDLGSNTGGNKTPQDYVSWTFRKAPRFFDVVTYTGTGSTRTIPHSLGVAPGMIIVKRLDAAVGWPVYHRSTGNTGLTYLNTTASSATSGSAWGGTDPTDSVFTVGTNVNNINGGSFVAYLYAHDPLGPSGDGSDGLIACGSYTGTGTSGSPSIDLGWEPQFVLTKRADSADNWIIQDNMRSLSLTNTEMLYPNLTSAATTGAYQSVVPTATGFYIGDNGTAYNASGGTYIYMAIRRGPMRTPEVGTEVFAMSSYTTRYAAGFPVDMAFFRRTASSATAVFGDRKLVALRMGANGKTAPNTSQAASFVFDDMTGWYEGLTSTVAAQSWMWRRAKGFFDVVSYTGTGTAGQTVSHSLGVTPEMIWVGCWSHSFDWTGYTAPTTAAVNVIVGSATAPSAPNISYWNNTEPTDTLFTLGTSAGSNLAGRTFIAYLFATLAGVSKVGSYTGNGSNQTIDCGFTSGARFILIKREDANGDWYCWDTDRGIVAGNDSRLSLNRSDPPVTTDDSVDPNSSGFIVNQVSATNINLSAATYIFYAIA